MKNETPETPLPGSARPSSAGLIVVGIIALAALAVSLYAAFARKSGPASPASGDATLNVNLASLENRLSDINKRLTSLEQRSSSTVAASAGEIRPATDAPTAPPPAPPAASLPVTAPAREPAGVARFEIVENADLKGRLGRLVLEFPEASDLKARTETFKVGDEKGLRTDFGNVAIEMTVGDYDLNVSGAVVTNVTIKSRHDTRVHVGVLRLNATSNTRFEVFSPGIEKSLGVYFGQTDVGLPVGTYEIDVNSQREPVTIERGRIAEF